jgi:hypothetical protein
LPITAKAAQNTVPTSSLLVDENLDAPMGVSKVTSSETNLSRLEIEDSRQLCDFIEKSQTSSNTMMYYYMYYREVEPDSYIPPPDTKLN